MSPQEVKLIFNIQLQVQIEVLRARVKALREYSLNRDFQLEANVLDKQIVILTAKHDDTIQK